MAVMAGALLMGATSAYYVARRTFGTKAKYEEPDLSAELPMVSLPAIVSDIDGVTLLFKENVPGSKETLEIVLAPLEKYQRRLPFTFFSNGGGTTEQMKA